MKILLSPSIVPLFSISLFQLTATMWGQLTPQTPSKEFIRIGGRIIAVEVRASSDTTPPVITVGPSAGSITSSGATINWTTDEASNTQVEYRQPPGSGNWNPVPATPNPAMVTSHSQALTGLQPNQVVEYRAKSADAAGNTVTSGILQFTTLPDTTLPVITVGPSAGSITSSGATITWTTDEASNTQVEYRQPPGSGNWNAVPSTPNPAMVTSHSQALTGLQPNQVAEYRAKSADAAGNTVTSGIQQFTTLADTTPPSSP